MPVSRRAASLGGLLLAFATLAASPHLAGAAGTPDPARAAGTPDQIRAAGAPDQIRAAGTPDPARAAGTLGQIRAAGTLGQIRATGTPDQIRAAGTLGQIRAAGRLACGAIAEPEDWTKDDLHGNIARFDIEICKAISVAALGEQAKLAMHLYATALEAGAGLKRGEVNVVVGMTPNATATWRDGILFGPPVFYDGLSVLVRGDSTIHRVADLAGAKVCYIEGTDNEDILLAHTVDVGIKLLPFPFQEEGEMEDGLSARHCDAIAADVTHLAIERAAYPRTLAHDRILDDWLAIDPIATATRADDRQWKALVDWTVYALIQAEQSGVTQANVGATLKRPGAEDPQIQRLMGADFAAARALGLADHGWAARVIAVVGNYGEIYDRTVGRPDALPRGRNALWSAGGLLVPMPVQ